MDAVFVSFPASNLLHEMRFASKGSRLQFIYFFNYSSNAVFLNKITFCSSDVKLVSIDSNIDWSSQ